MVEIKISFKPTAARPHGYAPPTDVLTDDSRIESYSCVRFDHDGPQQGTMLRDDPPEPLYEDCYSTEARDDS